MRKPLLPFGILPGHWGLKGKTRERAKAEYELEEYDLEIKLAEIDLKGIDLSLAKLNIDLKYKKITEKEFSEKSISLTLTGTDKELAELDNKLKYKEITKKDYDKLSADVKNVPWVHFGDVEIDPSNPNVSSVELDWNDAFVTALRDAGYQGPSDEQIVDQWFSTLCKNIALEEFAGVGDVEERLSQQQPHSRKKIDDDRWEVK